MRKLNENHYISATQCNLFHMGKWGTIIVVHKCSHNDILWSLLARALLLSGHFMGGMYVITMIQTHSYFCYSNTKPDIQRGCVLVTGYHCYIHAKNVLGLLATSVQAMHTILCWRFATGNHLWQGLMPWRSRVTLLLLCGFKFESGTFENSDTIAALLKSNTRFWVCIKNSSWTVR